MKFKAGDRVRYLRRDFSYIPADRIGIVNDPDMGIHEGFIKTRGHGLVQVQFPGPDAEVQAHESHFERADDGTAGGQS